MNLLKLFNIFHFHHKTKWNFRKKKKHVNIGRKIECHVMWINRKNAGGHILITSCKWQFFYRIRHMRNMQYSIDSIVNCSLSTSMQIGPQSAAQIHLRHTLGCQSVNEFLRWRGKLVTLSSIASCFFGIGEFPIDRNNNKFSPHFKCQFLHGQIDDNKLNIFMISYLEYFAVKMPQLSIALLNK